MQHFIPRYVTFKAESITIYAAQSNIAAHAHNLIYLNFAAQVLRPQPPFKVEINNNSINHIKKPKIFINGTKTLRTVPLA